MDERLRHDAGRPEMLLRRLYYFTKPYVPWRARLALRRMRARRILKECAGYWPIQESAAQKPGGWPGWPKGKRFAFVLTHNVESRRGLERVEQLAEIEIQLGFRSSFNFVPEGSYQVPADLRSWLANRGFEVGVHDLNHDGKLYSSRKEYERKAERINDYLKNWNAGGFRSAFMLSELEWLHDLDVEYDASTFDTDPFEPQPEGVATIFPFWMPATNGNGHSAAGGARKGYVELPYTLAQDSTLFLVLGEQNADVRQRKLDWIAAQGGMALVNIHPDYIDFEGGCGDSRKYPVNRVREFLDYVNKQHGSEAWNVTPRELAAWYRGTREAGAEPGRAPCVTQPCRAHGQPLAGKRAAVLLYSYYPADPRPRRAAEALVEAGMSVELLCLRDKDEAGEEVINGVNVSRLPLQKRRESKVAYLLQYGKFLISCFWFLARRGWRGSYDLVHVHNMPDALVFSALVPKLRGTPVILDLHDPMPELMMSIYRLRADHWLVRLLRRLERMEHPLCQSRAYSQHQFQKPLPLARLRAGKDRDHHELSAGGDIQFQRGRRGARGIRGGRVSPHASRLDRAPARDRRSGGGRRAG